MGFFSKLAQTKPGSTSRELEEAKASNKVRQAKGGGGGLPFSIGFDPDEDNDDEDETTPVVTGVAPVSGSLSSANYPGTTKTEITLKTHYFDHVPTSKAAYILTLSENTYVVFRRGSTWDSVEFPVELDASFEKFMQQLNRDDTYVYQISQLSRDEDGDDDYEFSEYDSEDDDVMLRNFMSDKCTATIVQVAGPKPEEE